MTPPQAYPLHWPSAWPRTAKPETGSAFRTTLPSALSSLREEIRRLGGTGLVLSSNCTLGNERPADPGVVAYFTWHGKSYAIPCDRWSKVEHNVRAIALTIEAMRGLERWGAKHMLEAMFHGFKALPGGKTSSAWWEVLRVPRTATLQQIREAYRALAKTEHPDAGGSDASMAALNKAYEEALSQFEK